MSNVVTTALRTRALRISVSVVACFVIASPPAFAQQDDWHVSLAPLYLSAAKTDGTLTAGTRTVPVFLDFQDAASNLSAAFSFHFEAGKGRWGLASDLNYMQLSTDATFNAPAGPVEGTLDYNQTIFELGGSYLVNPGAQFAIIGGLRTFTASPTMEFTRGAITLESIDRSRTSANAFGGFTYRPKLSDKVTFLSRADVGGGNDAFTWSALAGIEYQFRPWGGLVLAYKGLGIDTGSDTNDAGRETDFDLTFYGPVIGLNLHWGKQ